MKRKEKRDDPSNHLPPHPSTISFFFINHLIHQPSHQPSHQELIVRFYLQYLPQLDRQPILLLEDERER